MNATGSWAPESWTPGNHMLHVELGAGIQEISPKIINILPRPKPSTIIRVSTEDSELEEIDCKPSLAPLEDQSDHGSTTEGVVSNPKPPYSNKSVNNAFGLPTPEPELEEQRSKLSEEHFMLDMISFEQLLNEPPARSTSKKIIREEEEE
ncbi:hypothetical protein HDU97_007596 [Phlyctochytrium planicorne]|nr:hypothetical protein HDU97_007596 [Phlyctochytrium planicorne]